MSETWMKGILPETYEQTYFEYENQTSSEMGLTISASTSQHSPAYDIEFETVPGRDGDLAVDNERFEPFSYPVRVYLRAEEEGIHAATSRISKWLRRNIRYKPLFLSWDPEYVYSAIFFEQFDLEDTLPRFGKIALNFKCHPIKYAVSGLEKRPIAQNATLYNPEERAAKPLIELTGIGDIQLNVNGELWLILTDIYGTITVDSQNMTVYSDGVKAFDKMNANLRPMFPQLQPGANEISWFGNVEELYIVPRWESIV